MGNLNNFYEEKFGWFYEMKNKIWKKGSYKIIFLDILFNLNLIYWINITELIFSA